LWQLGFGTTTRTTTITTRTATRTATRATTTTEIQFHQEKNIVNNFRHSMF
jgi:hypothetical protein